MADRKRLEESIRILESQRGILGDDVVDSSVVILREKLEALNQSVVAQTGDSSSAPRRSQTVVFH